MNTKLNGVIGTLKKSLQGKVLTNHELHKEILKQTEILGVNVQIYSIEYLPDGRQQVTMMIKFRNAPDNMWEDKKLIHSGRKNYR